MVITNDYKKALKNKVILVTGGTGSFGNAVVKKLLEYEVRKIIIFSRDELKQEIMRNTYINKKLDFVIGDIRDLDCLNHAMSGVDYVFHAAAYKQVPMCEIYPMEAIKTNVLGGANVIESSIRNSVKRVVVLTTDKAVYPINAMGMSKALMEKIMVSRSNESTILCGVRYGNVMYSRGSVIPYFVSLIKKGETLQVTNPDMTRFLLTLDDAVELVLDTIVAGERGKIYVKRSPACTMETLAKALCELFNYDKGYKIVGIRTGEKIHETLIASETEPLTSENTTRLDVAGTKELLLTLPEIRDNLLEVARS